MIGVRGYRVRLVFTSQKLWHFIRVKLFYKCPLASHSIIQLINFPNTRNPPNTPRHTLKTAGGPRLIATQRLSQKGRHSFGQHTHTNTTAAQHACVGGWSKRHLMKTSCANVSIIVHMVAHAPHCSTVGCSHKSASVCV